MDIMIKQSVKPQASKVTFYLLAIVILGFGAFAEHNSHHTAEVNTQAVQIHSLDQ